MLTRFLVTYDIRAPRRLRRVFKCLKNYGEHIQLSVFDCILSEKDLLRLRADLAKRILAAEDQVLIARLGPADGDAASAVESLGIRFDAPDRVSRVL